MTTTKKMKRLLPAVIAAALVIATIPTALAAEGVFSDVPNGAWYADAVDYVYEHGIMESPSHFLLDLSVLALCIRQQRPQRVASCPPQMR